MKSFLSHLQKMSTKKTVKPKTTTGVAKKDTATTKKEGPPKKDATKKEGSKKTVPAKTNEKKVVKKSNKKEDKPKLGFAYGGELIKASRGVAFSCDENVKVEDYAKEHLEPYYGEVSGKYVDCEDASEALEALLKKAKEDGSLVHSDAKILKLSINNGVTLLKDVSGSTSAHNFTLSPEEKSNKTKKNKKEADEGDEAEDADNEGNENAEASNDEDKTDEEKDEDEEDNNEEQEQEEDDENEEDTQTAKKNAGKKTGNKPPAKTAGKKDKGPAKNTKKSA